MEERDIIIIDEEGYLQHYHVFTHSPIEDIAQRILATGEKAVLVKEHPPIKEINVP